MATKDQLLEVVAHAFAETGVDAALIGAQAVNAWAEPRLTYDIDVLVRSGRTGAIEVALGRLAHAGFEVRSRPTHPLPSGPDSVVIRDPATGLTFDVQTAKRRTRHLSSIGHGVRTTRSLSRRLRQRT